jgi:hypothetical protein
MFTEYMTQDFPDDLPSLLKRGIFLRNQSISNPEVAPKIQSVLTLDLDGDDNDFVIRFMLNLMAACSLNEQVPGIICRVLLNHLFNQIME